MAVLPSAAERPSGLVGGSLRVGADQVALLGPDTAAAGEDDAAPVPALSASPPTIAVLPSLDNATEKPCPAFPTAPVPTSLLPCCIHSPPLRVKPRRPGVRVVARPAHDGGVAIGRQSDGDALSGVSNRAGADQLVALLGPKTAAAGEDPRRRHTSCRKVRHDGGVAVVRQGDGEALPVGSNRASADLLPCWVQTAPLRVNTHAAPVILLSASPPTMAVLLSADSATDSLVGESNEAVQQLDTCCETVQAQVAMKKAALRKSGPMPRFYGLSDCCSWLDPPLRNNIDARKAQTSPCKRYPSRSRRSATWNK